MNRIKLKYVANKDLVHNFFWRSAQVFGKQGINFVIFVISAKLLDTYSFGQYNYILALVNLLVMFGDFGVSTATSRFVAEYKVSDEKKIKLILFNSAILIGALTAVIFLFVLIFGRSTYGDNFNYVLIILPMVFLLPLTSMYDGVYRGLKKFKQLSIISVISGIIALGAVYVLITNYGLQGALLAQVLFYLMLLIGLAISYRELHFKVDKKVIRDIGTYSLVFGLASLGYYLFSEIDVVILGHYGYIKEIANYQLLDKFFIICLLPLSIFSQVIAPDFTRMYALKMYSEVRAKFKQFVKTFAGIAGAFFVGALIVMPIVMKLFFKEYDNATFFMILIPVAATYALQAYAVVINAGIIVATGEAKLMTVLNFAIGGFNLVLALLLNSVIGFVGVMYATLLSTLIGIVILHWKFNVILVRKSKLSEPTNE